MPYWISALLKRITIIIFCNFKSFIFFFAGYIEKFTMKKTSTKKLNPWQQEKKYSGPETSLMISKKYSLEKIQNERIIDFVHENPAVSKSLLIRKKDVSRRHELKTSELSIKESNIHVIKPHEAKLMFLFYYHCYCFVSLITKQNNEAWLEGEFQLFPLAANSRRQLE